MQPTIAEDLLALLVLAVYQLGSFVGEDPYAFIVGEVVAHMQVVALVHHFGCRTLDGHLGELYRTRHHPDDGRFTGGQGISRYRNFLARIPHPADRQDQCIRSFQGELEPP